MKRFLLLALAVVPAALAFGSGCKKTVPTVEAGVMADAATATATDVDAAAPTAEVDAAPAPTLAATTAPAPTHVAAKPADAGAPATGGPFQATYSCFGGMTVTQTGSSASARMFPAKTDNYSTMTCTVNGEVCDGKVTQYTNGKAGESHHATLTKNTKGDLTYRGDGEGGSTFCRKK